MAGYDLGTAHGRVTIDSDVSGLDEANRRLEQTTQTGQKTGESLAGIGTKATLAGAVIAGGLAVAVNSAANFEQRLSAIQAVSGSTAAEMGKISDKALQIGKDTSFSATEAATAMEELSKAGVSTADILGGAADAVVALAAAGEVDLPTAATIASNAMNQFGLSADDMVGVVDHIAGAANASAIDVNDFGNSMSQVGAVAHLAGLSFDDTAVAIAELGNAGIVGSDAGTSLKTMLSNLTPSTKVAAEEMRALGIITADGSNQFYDAQGNVKSLAEIQQVLQNATKDLTAEQKQSSLATLFGSDAIRAAAVMAEQGAAGYNKMNDAIMKTSAADVAKTRMDNFKGTLEGVKGSAETLAIQLGMALLPALRGLLDGVGGILNFFLGMSDGMREAVVTGATVVASMLLVGGAIIKTVNAVKSMKVAMTALNIAMKANPVLAVVSIILMLVAAFVTAYTTSETFRNKVNAVMSAIGGFFTGMWNVAKGVFNFLKGAAEDVGAFFSGPFLDFFRNIGSFLAKWGPLILAVLAPFIGIPLLIAKYWDNIVEFFRNLPGVIGGFLSALPGMIATGLGFLLGLVVRMAIDGFMGLVHGVTTAWNATMQFLAALPGNLASFFLTLGMAIASGAQAAWDWIKNALVTAWNATIAFLTGLPASAAAALLSLKIWLAQTASDAWNGFQNAIVSAAQATLAWFMALPGNIKGTVSDAGSWLVSAGGDIIQGLWNGIQSIWNGFWSWASGLWQSFINGFKSAMGISSPSSVFMQFGVWILQGLWNGIQSMFGNVTSLLSNLVTTMINAFSAAGSWLLNAGKNLLTGLLNGATSMFSSVASGVGNIKNTVMNAISGAASWLVNAGGDLIRGFINGIKNMAGNVASAAVNVAKGAVNGVKSFLGINSPSRVFAAIGSGVGEGMIKGIDSQASNTVKSALSMAQGVVSTAKDVLDTGAYMKTAVSGSLTDAALAALTGATPSLGRTTGTAVRGAAPLTTVQGLAGKQMSGTVGGKTVNIEMKTYNPVAEKASDSEARKIRAAAAVGSF